MARDRGVFGGLFETEVAKDVLPEDGASVEGSAEEVTIPGQCLGWCQALEVGDFRHLI